MGTIYAGPGKINFSATQAIHAEGEGGRIVANIIDELVPVGSSLFGHVRSLAGDLRAEIDVTPFDDWAALPLLLPPRIGVSTPDNAAALAIGSSPFAAAVGAGTGCTIWTPDGRAYPFVMAAVTGHPDLHLGVDKPLFGSSKITCIGDPAKARSATDFLLGTITESAASDGGPALDDANIVRGAWTGNWGSVTGFTAIEAEDEWVISIDAQYDFYQVQRLTRAARLRSVQVTARARIYGPTHTQLVAQLAGKALGSVHGENNVGSQNLDLTLTGPDGRTVVVKNCSVSGSGFEFGGGGLGTGELVFATGMTITTGAADPLLVITDPA